jgi:hypothetical protein
MTKLFPLRFNFSVYLGTSFNGIQNLGPYFAHLRKGKKPSYLSLSERQTGRYQCVAGFEGLRLTSEPSTLTLAHLDKFRTSNATNSLTIHIEVGEWMKIEGLCEEYLLNNEIVYFGVISVDDPKPSAGTGSLLNFRLIRVRNVKCFSPMSPTDNYYRVSGKMSSFYFLSKRM